VSQQFVRRRGFTLVELLVVLTILAVLIAMSAAGILLVRRSAMQASRANDLRQVGLAWSQYNVDNKGKFVPGFLSPQMQRNLDMAVAYPDHTPIPPSPSFDGTLPNIGGPWTWRLVHYLANDLTPLVLPSERDILPITEFDLYGEQIAYHPSVAYNGWYVGGHWTVSSDGRRPLLSFKRARLQDRKVDNLVAESLGRMAHPSHVIVFMPGVRVDQPGLYSSKAGEATSWFEVTPPTLADVPQWQRIAVDTVETLVPDAAVPALDGSHEAPVFHADGSIEMVPLTELSHQDRWIDAARQVEDIPAREFTHEAE